MFISSINGETNDLKGSSSCCYIDLWIKKKFSVCTQTTVRQPLPMAWQNKKASFLKYVRDVIEKKKISFTNNKHGWDPIILRLSCESNCWRDCFKIYICVYYGAWKNFVWMCVSMCCEWWQVEADDHFFLKKKKNSSKGWFFEGCSYLC